MINPSGHVAPRVNSILRVHPLFHGRGHIPLRL
jgi:hypothetical protein